MRASPAAFLITLTLLTLAAQSAAGRARSSQGSTQAQSGSAVPVPRSIDIFPDATRDAGETAALAATDPRVEVYRTTASFDVVLNYYRFKRRQSVNVVEEDAAARFDRIGDLFAKAEPPSAALLADPFVRRFHAFAFGTRTPERAEAASAWRTHARRFDGRRQRIAEGARVTIFRPYISNRTFTLVDDTVIVLRKPGGGGR
jgi:hypothetical protein